MAGGLGVHITLDLAGQARFGPDVEWISSVDYAVDPARGEVFYDAVRTYWPGLRDGALQPGYAGIRPKISGPAEPAADFVVQGPETHGVPGLVNLYGIESPGLTASLPLADEVVRKLRCGRELIEETAVPAKPPKDERPSQDLRQAVAERVGLIAPVEIGRQGLTRDQREQDGADREINQDELDQSFHMQITCEEGRFVARNVDDLRTRYTVNCSPRRVSRMQPKPGIECLPRCRGRAAVKRSFAMLIGVPKEVKTHEYRVGLTPGSVRELVHHGHEVIVETGAGAGIGFRRRNLRSRRGRHRRRAPPRCSRPPS